MTTTEPARGEAKRGVGFMAAAGWGVGSIGVSTLLNTTSIYFPALMATVLGQSPALAGGLLTLSKLYDAFADITIGAVSDRTHSRFGRRRPYLLAGAVIGALSLLMLFVAPHPNGAGLAPFFMLGLVLYSTGYSLFNVPYIAMVSEMADDYHDRTRLLSFRMFFIAIGQIISLGVTAWLISAGGRGVAGYALMGVVAAALTFGVMTVSFLSTRHARRLAPAEPRPHAFREGMASILKNKPLALLIGTKFFQYISIAVLTSTQLLFLLNVLRLGYAGQINLALSNNITAALTMPLWPRIGRRFGKKPVFIASAVMLALVYASWLLAKPGEPMLLVWLRGAVSGFFSSGMILMGTSMLTDTMEYDRLKSGFRREGVFSSFYALVEKLGYALGPAITGFYLAAAGYKPTRGGALTLQSPGTIRALYAVSAWRRRRCC